MEGDRLFQKLRSDLALRLSNVKLLLVNAGGFTVNGKSANSIVHSIESLRESEVECVSYSESTSQEISAVAESLGIVLHQGVGDKTAFYKKIKEEYSLNDSDIALISAEENDFPIIERVNFSAAAHDAPLDVKKESYYAAYGTGQSAISEIASLITKAKNYPSGWSE